MQFYSLREFVKQILIIICSSLQVEGAGITFVLHKEKQTQSACSPRIRGLGNVGLGGKATTLLSVPPYCQSLCEKRWETCFPFDAWLCAVRNRIFLIFCILRMLPLPPHYSCQCVTFKIDWDL